MKRLSLKIFVVIGALVFLAAISWYLHVKGDGISTFFLARFFQVFAVIYGVSVTASIAVRHLLSERTAKVGRAALVGVFCLAFLLTAIGCYLSYNAVYRSHRAVEHNGLESAVSTAGLLFTYIDKNGIVPKAARWCDLVAHDVDTSQHSRPFTIGQYQNVPCMFALNENISGLPSGVLDGATVLFFEADGPWNNHGGQDLLAHERYKDRFFPRKKALYVYVCFLDGTIAKYRLSDESLAVFDPQTKKFSSYTKESSYLPLEWKSSHQTALCPFCKGDRLACASRRSDS